MLAPKGCATNNLDLEISGCFIEGKRSREHIYKAERS